MADDDTLTVEGDESPISVKDLYARAEQQRLAIENSTIPSSSPAYQDELQAALKTYAQCERVIAGLSLFSPNETLEDLSTSHLPFLLLDFHAATLIERIPASSPTVRLEVLGRARSAYERFLNLADSYSLLQPQYAAMLARYLEAPQLFSTVGSAAADPAARRNAKIANFRTEKELKQKLEVLRRNPRYVEQGGDEELVRETHLAALAFSAHMAFQALESLNREEEVVGQAARAPVPEISDVTEDERRRRRQAGDGGGAPGPEGYTDRLDSPMTMQRLNTLLGGKGPLLNHEGKPLQPFTLVSARQEVQKGVFRSGHNLPTMSIDEYLEEERRQGNIIEGGGEASMRVPEPDEDDYEKADAETMKQRHWDDFTEENPRGWGNTLNRG